jgi:SAM-dependent methyltransferase
MKEFFESTYGDRIAPVYDEWYGEYEPAIIDTLSELAQGGRTLELGIGSGRIALPLHHSGIEIQGIDASEAMLARLKEKPGGEDIQVTLGNFADVDVEGQFKLIYVVFNTFFALGTQDEQVQCFKNVVDRLTPDGSFLIEAFVPDMARFIDQQSVRVGRMEVDEVFIDVSQLDMLNQQVSSQHIVLSEEGVHLYPVKLRYAWPAELDLMARLANLTLKERWGSWGKEPYTNESTRHISVYSAVQ